MDFGSQKAVWAACKGTGDEESLVFSGVYSDQVRLGTEGAAGVFCWLCRRQPIRQSEAPISAHLGFSSATLRVFAVLIQP